MTEPGSPRPPAGIDYPELARKIKRWGQDLGFQQVGIADADVGLAEQRLANWLAAGFHGEMAYMARHGTKRSRPSELIAGTRRVICVRMDYLPEGQDRSLAVLQDPATAFVSRYALGRDYHKLMRGRLKQLAQRIDTELGTEARGFPHRPFVDSAPVLEKPLAQRAGLGWIGKHTNLIHTTAGSWFFLGEIYTDIPLPPDRPAEDHCGTCRACMDICPTGAIVAPYVLDARLCISYLTIELAGSIPLRLRPLIGNRVYGCDDCQLVCPWNRFARLGCEPDFKVRWGLDKAALPELFSWSEADFLRRTEGSPIRRIGYLRWLRNLGVALGNAPGSPSVEAALRARLSHPSEMVREHTAWALARQTKRAKQPGTPSA